MTPPIPRPRPGRRFGLEPRVHGLAFEREDAEDALVDTPERLAAYKTLEGLNAERRLEPVTSCL